MILAWWVVPAALAGLLGVVVMAACVLDARRSRGNWFEEEITKREWRR